MKYLKNKFLILLIGSSCTVFANVNTKYQFKTNNDSSRVVYSKSSDVTQLQLALTLDTAIDDVTLDDPRLKSIILLSQLKDKRVEIVYYSKDIKSYVFDLVELFKVNKAKNVFPYYQKTTNLINLTKVNIFIGKESYGARTESGV